MIISVGDGRTIDHTEGALRVPPPVPKKKRPPQKKKKPRKGKSVTLRGFTYKFDPRPERPKRALPAGVRTVAPGVDFGSHIEGLVEWRNLRAKQSIIERPGKDLGAANGLTTKQSEARWAVARRKAKKDMAVIREKIDLTDAAAEALEATLATMRSPMSQATKLSAAKLVLEYTMAKPVAKSEVTVNAAEKWLEELADR